MYVVTALTCDRPALVWQMLVQCYNLSNLGCKKHLVLLVGTDKTANADFEKIEQKIPPKTQTKRVVLSNELDCESIAVYPALAKLFGLGAAVQIFVNEHFLLVDPDVVFVYDPEFRLTPLIRESGKIFASNCSSYLNPSALPAQTRRYVYGNRLRVGDYKYGGAQYLISPGSLNIGKVEAMIALAARIYSIEKLWIAEMLAWIMACTNLHVHRLMNFKLASSPFSFVEFGKGNETLMIHLAGETATRGALDKSKYDEKDPFLHISDVSAQCTNPEIASYFYASMIYLAHSRICDQISSSFSK